MNLGRPTLIVPDGVSSLSAEHVWLRAGHSPEVLELRSHACLSAPVFGCPQCRRDCYKLYLVADRWACRKCDGLDWACRHRNRSIPGYNRLLSLRRRLDAELSPFAPLPKFPSYATRKRALAEEILELESCLVGHLQTITGHPERRIRSRKEKRKW